MYDDLRGKNFEIIAAAQDVGGEAAAGKWYDNAKATFTQLIDTKHAVSSAFHFVNVPTGVWIDEKGQVVRPGEPSWTTNQTFNARNQKGEPIVTEGEKYVAALRDWVEKGEHSQYAMSDEAFAARVQRRSASAMEAEASFKLAVWFQQAGKKDRADVYFARAQQLNPDDWNYHRQQWSFEGQAAGKKFQEKVQKLETPYYPKLELDRKQ